MTLDIEAIKARAEKAARMWTLDSHVASARDIPALLAALEASEAARVKAEQDFDKCREHLAYREVTLEIADDIEALDNARITALEAERDALRETNRKLHRRAQFAEKNAYRFIWTRANWIECLSKSISHKGGIHHDVEKFVEEIDAKFAAIRNQEPER